MQHLDSEILNVAPVILHFRWKKQNLEFEMNFQLTHPLTIWYL